MENQDKPFIKKALLQFGFLLIVAVIAYNITAYFMSATSQPIEFNHKKHISGNGDINLNCLQCHVYGYDEPNNAKVNDSIAILYRKFVDQWKKETKDRLKTEKRIVFEPAMVIPNIDFCMNCHEDMDIEKAYEKTKGIQQLAAYFNSNKRIPWQRNYKVPDHVVYPHGRHVAYGHLDCKNCHGDIASQAGPVTRPVSKTVDMFNGCLACHEENYPGKQGSDCLTCHK